MAILGAQHPHRGEDCLLPCDDGKTALEKEGLLSAQSGVCARDAGFACELLRFWLGPLAEAGEVVLGELRVGWDRVALTTVVVFWSLLLPVHNGSIGPGRPFPWKSSCLEALLALWFTSIPCSL